MPTWMPSPLRGFVLWFWGPLVSFGIITCLTGVWGDYLSRVLLWSAVIPAIVLTGAASAYIMVRDQRRKRQRQEVETGYPEDDTRPGTAEGPSE